MVVYKSPVATRQRKRAVYGIPIEFFGRINYIINIYLHVMEGSYARLNENGTAGRGAQIL